MKIQRQLLGLLLLCFVFGAILSVTAQAYGAVPSGEHGATGTVADNLLKSFHDRFKSFEEKIYTAAKGLFAALFLCQFVWAVLQLFLQESLTFAAVVATVVRQIMMGGFFYWFLVDRTILTSIVSSFEQLASSGLKISELLFLMENSAETLMRYVAQSTSALSGFALFLTALLTCIIMAFAVTTAVGYWAIVMLENYIVASLGVILLGFGGSEYTRNYALSYIKTLVHIGFKLFLCTVIVQVGVIAMRKTVGITDAELSSESVNQLCLLLIAQSFFFLALVKVIPQIADTLIAGVSMGIGHGGAMIRSGWGGAAALGGGLAMGAGRVAGGTVAGTAAATGAAANAYHTSRQSGRGISRSAMSGAGGFLGQSVLGVGTTVQNVFRGVRNNLADHGILRTRGPQADMSGAVKGQVSGVWSKHRELKTIDEVRQQSSMSAPDATSVVSENAQNASKTENASAATQAQQGGGRGSKGKNDETHVSNLSGEALKAPTAEELSKRLGVGDDV